jgi:glycosyltransferase involved in cell wall biosynthesis
LKVLLVSSTSLHTGTGRRVASFAEGLSKLGHSVDVLAPPEDGKRMYSNTGKAGFFWKSNNPSYKDFLMRGANHLTAIPDGIRLVLDDYDIVHIFATALPYQAILTMITRLFNRRSKLVVDWDDMWGLDVPKNTFISHISPWVLTTLQYSTCSRSDGLCVVSPTLQHFAERIGIAKEKTAVIPNICRIDKITPGDKKRSRSSLGLGDYPIVLVIGYPYANGAYVHGFRLLFQAFSNVMKAIPSARLVMVGNEVVPSSLMPSYDRVRSAMIRVGAVPFSALTSYLRSADVLYFPMDPTVINDYYRWPIRFCDYLSSGKPIVSNAVGAVRNVMTDENCALVAPSDDKEIADRLVSVLRDDSLGEKMGCNARRTAEKYSMTRVSFQIETFYKSLM